MIALTTVDSLIFDDFALEPIDFVVEGDSYRPKLEPKIEAAYDTGDEGAVAATPTEATTLIERHPTDRATARRVAP